MSYVVQVICSGKWAMEKMGVVRRTTPTGLAAALFFPLYEEYAVTKTRIENEYKYGVLVQCVHGLQSYM